MNASACTVETPLATFLVSHRVRMMQVSVFVTASLLLLRHYRPSDLPSFDVMRLSGVSLITLGLAIRSWAAAILNKTTVLATCGPYSMFRHPLYVGSSLMLLGFCVLIGDPLTAVLLMSTWIITYPATVAREESRLAQVFHEQWPAYAERTPRLIPRRLPADLGNPSLERWLRNREYQAMIAAVLGIVGVEAWRILF